VEPYGRRFLTIKNPVVAGRNLEYTDMTAVASVGTEEELTRCMASIRVEDVYRTVLEVLA